MNPVIKCSVPSWTRMTFHFCNRPPKVSCRNCEKVFCAFHFERHPHAKNEEFTIKAARLKKPKTSSNWSASRRITLESART